MATLSNGKANISFDPAFAAAVSSKSPVIVTVTPIGNSNGVYLESVSQSGFSIAENNSGKSNITVNYIAIGKREGYEHPDLPAEVTGIRSLHRKGCNEKVKVELFQLTGKICSRRFSEILLLISADDRLCQNLREPQSGIILRFFLPARDYFFCPASIGLFSTLLYA